MKEPGEELAYDRGYDDGFCDGIGEGYRLAELVRGALAHQDSPDLFKAALRRLSKAVEAF